ncbi:hypothetical protein GA0115261_101271, partial [Streptomyces sp. OspMP-M43]
MPVAERVRVRETDDDEERRLLRIIRRGSGSEVTWRRTQMVLLSAQRISVAKIAEVAFQMAPGMRTGRPRGRAVQRGCPRPGRSPHRKLRDNVPMTMPQPHRSGSRPLPVIAPEGDFDA